MRPSWRIDRACSGRQVSAQVAAGSSPEWLLHLDEGKFYQQRTAGRVVFRFTVDASTSPDFPARHFNPLPRMLLTYIVLE